MRYQENDLVRLPSDGVRDLRNAVQRLSPHKQNNPSRSPPPKRAEVFFFEERSVARLAADVLRLVDLAIGTLGDKPGVASGVEPQRSPRHQPRFQEKSVSLIAPDGSHNGSDAALFDERCPASTTFSGERLLFFPINDNYS